MVNFARLRVNMVASSEERVGLDAMVRASRLREGGVAVAAGSGGSGGELAGEMRDLDSDVSALEMSLRRLRVPLILAVSAGVLRVVPSLSSLKVSALLAAPFVTLFPFLMPSAPAPAELPATLATPAAAPAVGEAHAAALRKYSRLAATPLPPKVAPPAAATAAPPAELAAWDAYRTKRAAGRG